MSWGESALPAVTVSEHIIGLRSLNEDVQFYHDQTASLLRNGRMSPAQFTELSLVLKNAVKGLEGISKIYQIDLDDQKDYEISKLSSSLETHKAHLNSSMKNEERLTDNVHLLQAQLTNRNERILEQETIIQDLKNNLGQQKDGYNSNIDGISNGQRDALTQITKESTFLLAQQIAYDIRNDTGGIKEHISDCIKELSRMEISKIFFSAEDTSATSADQNKEEPRSFSADHQENNEEEGSCGMACECEYCHQDADHQDTVHHSEEGEAIDISNWNNPDSFGIVEPYKTEDWRFGPGSVGSSEPIMTPDSFGSTVNNFEGGADDPDEYLHKIGCASLVNLNTWGSLKCTCGGEDDKNLGGWDSDVGIPAGHQGQVIWEG